MRHRKILSSTGVKRYAKPWFLGIFLCWFSCWFFLPVPLLAALLTSHLQYSVAKNAASDASLVHNFSQFFSLESPGGALGVFLPCHLHCKLYNVIQVWITYANSIDLKLPIRIFFRSGIGCDSVYKTGRDLTSDFFWRSKFRKTAKQYQTMKKIDRFIFGAIIFQTIVLLN